MREKLIELLKETPIAEINGHIAEAKVCFVSHVFESFADHLIANGVTIPVRCKECKHRGDYGCPMYHEEYIEWDDDEYHEREIIDHDRTRDDGFCDLGERRTDG